MDSEAARRKLGQLLEKEVDEHNRASDAARIIAHAERAQIALAKFGREVVRHYISHLETLVVSALNFDPSQGGTDVREGFGFAEA